MQNSWKVDLRCFLDDALMWLHVLSDMRGVARLRHEKDQLYVAGRTEAEASDAFLLIGLVSG